jgi:hypothetical protein
VTTLHARRGDKTAGGSGAGRGGGRRTQRGHLHGRRSSSWLSSRQIQHASSSASGGTRRGRRASANGCSGRDWAGRTRRRRLGSSRAARVRGTNRAAYRRRRWPRTWSCEGPRPSWRDARRVLARVPRGSGLSCRTEARLARGQSENRAVARTTRARTPRVGTRERPREILGARRVSREEPSSAFGRDEILRERGNGVRVRGFGALLRGTGAVDETCQPACPDLLTIRRNLSDCLPVRSERESMRKRKISQLSRITPELC